MTSISDWDVRFKQQAGWTASIRSYLFSKAGISSGKKVLDLGCGTGVLISEMEEKYDIHSIGMDIDYSSIKYAKNSRNISNVICADAYRIPLPDSSIDVALFHFVLLWLQDPVKAITEVKRCLKPEGWLLCLAEPDHGSRVDYPPPLDDIGRLQTESLEKQGADIQAGRKLGVWLHQSGFNICETGVLGSQWSPEIDQSEINLEWEWLARDGVNQYALSAQTIRDIDLSARKNGSRVLNVPTYYACAKKV